jgi:hypothetical protein
VNVLIIPEDFRKDQYVLKPIIQRMLAEVGKPKAKVQVCLDPVLGGVREATKWDRIGEIIEMYRGMVQLFLLIVDRDGIAGRRQSLNSIEAKAHAVLGNAGLLLAENAWQEIEVWALAGLELPKDWSWKDIRQEVNPKEVYFAPLVAKRGLASEPGQGRTTLGREAAANYRRVRSRCGEDVKALEDRIATWVGS